MSCATTAPSASSTARSAIDAACTSWTCGDPSGSATTDPWVHATDPLALTASFTTELLDARPPGELGAQGVEALVPEVPVAVEPPVHLQQRGGVDGVQPPRALRVRLHEHGLGRGKRIGKRLAVLLGDQRRQFVDKAQYKAAYAKGPSGHGFAFVDPKELEASAGSATRTAARSRS